MREGYFLIHRQLLDRDAWKNPKRTLAWIDMISMADHKTHCVTASVRWLGDRWGVSKSTVGRWVDEWTQGHRVTRKAGQEAGQDMMTIFIVNYAKYQQPAKTRKGRAAGQEAGRAAGQRETSTIRTRNNIPSTNVLGGAGDDRSQDALPPAPIDSETKPIQKHMLPYAMFCFLFGVKFTSKEQRHALFQRNVKISRKLSDVPVRDLASAMLLMEDHWAKKGDFPLRLETAHRFLEDYARAGLPVHLEARLREFGAGFKKIGPAVFDIHPELANASHP